MTSTLDSQLSALESLLDTQYGGTVPHWRSWEVVVAHLLLAHSCTALASQFYEHLNPPPGPWSPSVESRKHALMHAVRMLHALDSRPFVGVKERVDESLLEWADSFLRLGEEYDAVTCGFTIYRTGSFDVAELTDTRLLLSPKAPEEAAYDVADHYLHSPYVEESAFPELPRLMSALLSHARSMNLRNLFSTEEARALMEPFRGMKAVTWQLPSQWSFKGVPITILRAFWTALALVGTVTLTLGFATIQQARPGWDAVLWTRRSELSAILAFLSDLRVAEVDSILDWHIYDRAKAKSDIALTPFVTTGPGYIITSPELLSTSRFERNFYANASRVAKREIDTNSHLLAPQMALELASAFRARGFWVATQVSFESSLGKSDIDLLVFSAAESAVLALELKWFVSPADYREVLNLDEKAGESLLVQLPKYKAAISEVPGELLCRAFDLSEPPKLRSGSVGLVMRNYAGRADLRRHAAWFAPEAAVLTLLKQSNSLMHLTKSLEQFEWLPQLGKDYEIAVNEIVSPGGIMLGVPAYRVTGRTRPTSQCS